MVEKVFHINNKIHTLENLRKYDMACLVISIATTFGFIQNNEAYIQYDCGSLHGTVSNKKGKFSTKITLTSILGLDIFC